MAATAANVSYIYEINGGGGGGGTQNGGNGVAVASSAPPNSAPMHNGVMQVGNRVESGEGQRLVGALFGEALKLDVHHLYIASSMKT